MSKTKSPSGKPTAAPAMAGYARLLGDIDHLIVTARSLSARAVNAVMTATYWDAGRQIVEFEQGGNSRAAYGTALLERLSSDLTSKHGRGFSVDNLERFRLLYLRFPMTGKSATELRISESPIRFSGLSASGRKISATPLRKSEPAVLAWIETLTARLPLSWSHYTRLLRVKSHEAFAFYHAEALRGGWNIKQLERQIGSLFYERAMLSKNKAAMLTKGAMTLPRDASTPDGYGPGQHRRHERRVYPYEPPARRSPETAQSNRHPTNADAHCQQRPAPTRTPGRPPRMTGARSTAVPKSGSGVPPLNAPDQKRRDAAPTLGHASQNTSNPEGAKQGGKLPSGWIRLTMGEVGRWFGGGTPSKANPLFWTGGNIPWVSPKDMKFDVITDAQDHVSVR